MYHVRAGDIRVEIAGEPVYSSRTSRVNHGQAVPDWLTILERSGLALPSYSIAALGASLLVLLWRRGDAMLRPSSRDALVEALFDRGNWVRVAQLFFAEYLLWFDKLFRTRTVALRGHVLQIPSLWRSALASTIALSSVFLVWWQHLGFKGARQVFAALGEWSAVFILGAIVTNILPDYVSLLITRALLGRIHGARRAIATLGWVAVDTCAKLGIAFVAYATALGIAVAIPMPTSLDGIRLSNFTLGAVLEAFAFGLSFTSPTGGPLWEAGGVYVYSSFFTSIWLWLFMSSALLTKVAFAAQKLRSFVKRHFQVDHRPIRLLAGGLGTMLVAIALLTRWNEKERYDVYVDRDVSGEASRALAKQLTDQGMSVFVPSAESRSELLTKMLLSTWVIVLRQGAQFGKGNTDFGETTRAALEQGLPTGAVRWWPAWIDVESADARVIVTEFARSAKYSLPVRFRWPKKADGAGPSVETLDLALLPIESSCSRACVSSGLCSVFETTCVASEASCLVARPCRESGSCTFSNGRCLPTADSCSNSRDCRSQGRCGFAEDRCISTPPGCADSIFCARFGACEFAGPNRPCAPNANGCKNSESCRIFGSCELNDGRCQATAASCLSSRHCRRSGHCSWIDGACHATAESCEASASCKEDGYCLLKSGQCHADQATCSASEGCLKEGRCHWRKGRPLGGHHSLEAGTCEATGEGCSSSTACETERRCTLRDGKCVAMPELPASTG